MKSTRLVWLAAAFLALGLPACDWDGQFTVLGYTTRPNYDCNIKTVRVPIFKNNTYRQGLEFDLTRAVVKAIESKTPYKVVNCDSPAETELTGTIVSYTKGILNRNQLNEVREAEMNLAVELVWKDLRSGEILSRPRSATPPPIALGPLGVPEPPPPPPPIIITSQATFIPELGASFTTAVQQNVDRLAVQIVSMMETPW